MCYVPYLNTASAARTYIANTSIFCDPPTSKDTYWRREFIALCCNIDNIKYLLVLVGFESEEV